MEVKVFSLICVVVTVVQGHLLPQALEDVHTYVQKELSHRSQGVDGPPPSGGPSFQTTQTFIGTPVVIQKEMRLDGKGGIQLPGFPIHGDLDSAGSSNIAQAIQAQIDRIQPPAPPAAISTGLVPPVPLTLNPGDHAAQGSNIISANVVGPSTFISNAPRGPPSQQQQYHQQTQTIQQYKTSGSQQIASPSQQYHSSSQQPQDKKQMEGWVPLGSEGAILAKGVGVKLQVDDELRATQQQDRKPDYEGTSYSIQDNQEKRQSNLEIIPTNSIKLGENPNDNIVLEQSSSGGRGRFAPVYPGKAGSPKVVIHAQNVIIRGGPDGSIQEIQAINDTAQGNPGVKQYAAYGGVPQLNNFLREQLRSMAMQHLIQAAIEEHPLNKKPFPRPLSLREIAQAVRNGQFPQPSRDQLHGLDPMTAQPTMLSPTHMQLNLPHMVRLRPGSRVPDPYALPSIQTQSKLTFPGGLRNLYKNLVQHESAGGYYNDPRQPLDLSFLAALSGQNVKVPQVRAPSSVDYGDSVKYTAAGEGKGKDGPSKTPIQILETEPDQLGLIVKQHPQQGHSQGNSGSLRDISEQVLKQLLIQELQGGAGASDEEQVLLPAGLGPQASPIHGPLRTPLRPAYGTNSHPFAFLSEEGGAGAASYGGPGYEETFEYTLPPGTSIDDFMSDDGGSFQGLGKGPRPPPYSYGGGAHEGGGDPDVMPLNTDTLKELGMGVFNSALEFSRNHNPLTFLQRIRSLPPVKVDLYKVPMGIPDGLMKNLSNEWKSGGDGGGGGDGPPDYGPAPPRRPPPRGPPPPRHHGGRGGRGRKKHLPRKNNKFYK